MGNKGSKEKKINLFKHLKIEKNIPFEGKGLLSIVENTKVHKLYYLRRIPKSLLSEEEYHFFKHSMKTLLYGQFQNVIIVEGYDLTQLDTIDLLLAFNKTFTLRHFLNRMDSVELEQAVFICYKLVHGLKELRSRNIIYHGLTPSTVYFNTHRDSTEGFEIKLYDFFYDEKVWRILRETHFNNYLAIENYHINSEDDVNTDKSDVWSIGCILYEMIFSIHPFCSNSLESYTEAIDRFQAEQIFPEESQVPYRILDLITKCLKKDPNERIGIDEFESILFKEVAKKSMYLISEAKVLGVEFPFHFKSEVVLEIAHKGRRMTICLLLRYNEYAQVLSKQ